MDRDDLKRYAELLQTMENVFDSSQDVAEKKTAESELSAEELQARVKQQADMILRLRALIAENPSLTDNQPSVDSIRRENSESSRIEMLEQHVKDRGFELQRLKILLDTLSFDESADIDQPSLDEKEESISEQAESVSESDGGSADAPSAAFVVAERLTFVEAYRLLLPKQKRYCDELVKYAVKKSGISEKYAKYHLSVGVGAKQLLKLGIKDGTVIAYFRVEDQRMRELRRKSGDAAIKIKETLLQVDNDDAVIAAKEIIDLRETQILEDIAARKNSKRHPKI